MLVTLKGQMVTCKIFCRLPYPLMVDLSVILQGEIGC